MYSLNGFSLEPMVVRLPLVHPGHGSSPLEGSFQIPFRLTLMKQPLKRKACPGTNVAAGDIDDVRERLRGDGLSPRSSCVGTFWRVQSMASAMKPLEEMEIAPPWVEMEATQAGCKGELEVINQKEERATPACSSRIGFTL
jgi:hypothetical protein